MKNFFVNETQEEIAEATNVGFSMEILRGFSGAISGRISKAIPEENIPNNPWRVFL